MTLFILVITFLPFVPLAGMRENGLITIYIYTTI